MRTPALWRPPAREGRRAALVALVPFAMAAVAHPQTLAEGDEAHEKGGATAAAGADAVHLIVAVTPPVIEWRKDGNACKVDVVIWNGSATEVTVARATYYSQRDGLELEVRGSDGKLVTNRVLDPGELVLDTQASWPSREDFARLGPRDHLTFQTGLPYTLPWWDFPQTGVYQLTVVYRCPQTIHRDGQGMPAGYVGLRPFEGELWSRPVDVLVVGEPQAGG